jgi:hypothetical protein
MRRRSSVLAALGLTVSLVGCGHSQPTERGQVAAYLKQVNAVERQLAAPLADVSRTSARLAGERPGGSNSLAGFITAPNVAPLYADASRIRTLGHRLTAISTPVPARHLRALLGALIARQVQLTNQTAGLLKFLPGLDRALGPLVPATHRLQLALAANHAYGAAAVQAIYIEKAAALRAFQATLQRILAMMRRLDPPPVSKPNYDAQVAAVEGMKANAGKLATALLRHDSAGIPVLLSRFGRAAATPHAIRVQRAQIAAAKAYNHAVAQLRGLSTRADRERLRLANTLQ